MPRSKFQSVRRKSSAFVANLLHGSGSFLVPQSRSSHALDANKQQQQQQQQPPNPRRMSIYEMTKSPPPETSIEMYLNERRRSSTVSAKFVQQQLEQQSTFESNYCARQQYFKDLNSKLINQDKKLLNVVANRGQIHRHSVDIAQLPLFLAQSKSGAARAAGGGVGGAGGGPNEQSAGESLGANEAEILKEEDEEEFDGLEGRQLVAMQLQPSESGAINQAPPSGSSLSDMEDQQQQQQQQQQQPLTLKQKARTKQQHQLAPISEAKTGAIIGKCD